jgi:hypothetical protein
LTLGTSGAPQDLPTAYFGGWTESRKFILSVDMSIQQQKGKFDPARENVVVRGWNGWGLSEGIPMSSSGSGIYTAAAYLNSVTSADNLRQYKFFVTGKTPEDSGYELVWNLGYQDNRAASTGGLANFGSNTSIPIVYFSNDDGVGPNIVLNGADPIHIEEGAGFVDPGVDSARDQAENTNFKNIPNAVSVLGAVDDSTLGTYTLTYKVSDNSGNESLKTRTVVVDPRPLTPFEIWSGGVPLGSDNLAKYAIGGASNLTAQGEAPRVGTGFIVPNHYSYIEAIVRTDDSKLTIVGEASTDLDAGFASTGSWTTRGQADGVSQLDVPNGCERKRFIYWHGMVQERMFLRLRATLNP